MTDNSIWGLHGEKKTLTIGSTKPAQAPTKPIAQPLTAPQPNAVNPKVKPVKASKTKKVKVRAQVQKSVQTPQYNLADFRIQTTMDNVGIHIFTIYLGIQIHHFLLPVAQYTNWQKSPPQAKYNYVRFHTVASAFFGDLRLVETIIQATINVIDNLFIRARQAQQKARM